MEISLETGEELFEFFQGNRFVPAVKRRQQLEGEDVWVMFYVIHDHFYSFDEGVYLDEGLGVVAAI